VPHDRPTTSQPVATGLAEKLQRPTALLVIDMQNDFCASGGYIDRVMGKDVQSAATVVPPIQRMVDAARRRGVPVIWVMADYSHAALPASMRSKLLERNITQACCAPGSWGAELFQLQANADEPQVIKHTYSGFHRTSLHETLQRRGIETLVFTGVQTHICVESSLRDAHSLGYYCVMLEDAVSAHTPAAHQATVDNVNFLFGDACPSQTVLDAWQA